MSIYKNIHDLRSLCWWHYISGPDTNTTEEVIAWLGAQNDEQQYMFELRDEGEVGDF